MVAGQGGSLVRQAEDVCFSAVERLDAELFESRSSGFIGGVRFTHSGGGVSCVPDRGLTDFECREDGLMTLLVSETRGAVMYPAAMTEDITGWGYGPNMMFDWNRMSRVDDGILTLIQPIYRVRRWNWPTNDSTAVMSTVADVLVQ